MAVLSRQRAHQLLRAFRRQRILVVGDLMLDRYLHGEVQRISPEAPVPVVRIRQETNMPGGAANTARNVCALGGGAMVCGLLGQDAAGAELLAALEQAGVDTTAVLQLPATRTTVKTRVIAERQQVARLDWEDGAAQRAPAARALRAAAVRALDRADGVIIADYAKGAVRRPLVAALLAAARRRGLPTALDPKAGTRPVAGGLTALTPNRREAFALAGVPEQPPAENPLQDAALLRVAESVLRQWRPRLLVITLGAQGMLLARRRRPARHIPTVAREVFDVSGAGDTVIAALLLALSAGAGELEAAALATCAAGVVVGKRGTAVCSGSELLDFYHALAGAGRRRPA